MGDATGIHRGTMGPESTLGRVLPYRIDPHLLSTWLLVLVGAVLAYAQVVVDPPPSADQQILLDARWPSPIQAFVPQTVAAALGVVVPDHLHNHALKVAAASLVLASTAVVASKVAPRWAPVAVLLVASSQVVTTHVSSEVVVAAAVLWVVAAALSGRTWMVGLCCALVALSKPDALLVAVVAAGWFGWSRRSWVVPGTFVGTFLLAVLPGTMLVDEYWVYSAAESSRTWVAFGQHFANAVGVHDLPGGPSPWVGWRFYVGRLLPGAGSLPDVVRMYPGEYLRFLWHGWLTGAIHFVVVFGPLAAVGVWAVTGWRRLGDVGRGALVMLVGVAPHLFVTFPQYRHLVRWYPLAAIGAALILSRTSGWRRTAGLVLVVATVGWHLTMAVDGHGVP